MKSLINSLRKERKLLRWSPTCPRPRRRPQPLPPAPPAGRSRSGPRTPSSPCELLCGSRPRRQVTAQPCPCQALVTPPSLAPTAPALLCLHGNTTVCAPRPPTSQYQLQPPSIWLGDRHCSQRPFTAPPLPPLPSALLPVFPSRKNGQPQARPSTQDCFLSRHWDYPSCHLPYRDRGQVPAPSPCALAQAADLLSLARLSMPC